MKTYTRVLVVFTRKQAKSSSVFDKIKLAVFGMYFKPESARFWNEGTLSFFEFIADNEDVLEGPKQVANLKKIKGFAGLEIQEVELIDMKN